MRSLLPFRRRKNGKSRGQSLVEFALVLPVFLVFVAAALDLGRVFFANVSLNNAAREGAFVASKNPQAFGPGQSCDATDAGQVVCRVQFEARNTSIAITDNDVSATCSNSCNDVSGSTITVTVRGQFKLLTPILSAIFNGTTIPITSSATAQIEWCNPSACADGVATPPPPPAADFTCTPTTITVGASVTCTDSSTGAPEAWTWDFGDGGTSTAQGPVTHQYTAAGDFTVKLTAINISGSNTRTRNNYIHVNAIATPTPSVSIAPTPTPTPACAHPPDVMGQNPGTAVANLNNAGWTVSSLGDLTTGPKNKVQAQNPDATQCKDKATTLVTIHWRPS